jgi:GTPase SAR1 family protein
MSVEVPASPQNSLAYLQKIIMLGSSKVGKTALGVKFVQRSKHLDLFSTEFC